MRKRPQEPSQGLSDAVIQASKRTHMETPTLLQRMTYASWMYTTQSIVAGFVWLHGWKEWHTPPDSLPDIVKAYDCRPHLPVRIFFPASHDQSSPTPLPTLVTIHGGGFCMGTARDADEWNRDFANKHNVLVVSLGQLDEEEGGDERFGFDDHADGKGVKWMLVPDVLHGFDCKAMRDLAGGEEAIEDAEMKTVHEIERIGRWLREKAWKI
ncbi:hypothetical protein MAPG_04655 [Magnaporthiopsis poae ATCC 64411]|uniref:Uncharacterized protein n=1 Tax=Magnaporthiopsis poae (strain ATCC 64411 / 73-15) TaxID=644358 RepID=A0A0C4DXB4_MAGP6|nr:hypothetical protein MAPG_04655 [Magnaporthiopsis poae ATCC 64411]